ncbi:MAG: hypothetical protein U0164_23945 [Gemmatimonadaceae bacterium]
MSSDDDGVSEPDFEVWNHLESGWQMAYDDIRFKLEPESLSFYESLARLIVHLKSQLRFDSRDPVVRRLLAETKTRVDEGDHDALLRGLLIWYSNGTDKWLTHLVHLEIASQGIDRARTALKRFDLIAARLGGAQTIPERSLEYLREVVDAFLFGFDAATVALARGTLEQLAKEILLRIGAVTKPQLERERPDLESLVAKLRQAGALNRAADAATRLRERGNTVLHKHLYDDRIRQQVALDSITDLTEVLGELVP